MAQDDLVLTIRVHDPIEKKDASKAACWTLVKVPRADANLPAAEFIAKYIHPELSKLGNLSLA